MLLNFGNWFLKIIFKFKFYVSKVCYIWFINMCIYVLNLIYIILELVIFRVCYDGGIIVLKVFCVGMSEL